jgi:hypothetical protein
MHQEQQWRALALCTRGCSTNHKVPTDHRTSDSGADIYLYMGSETVASSFFISCWSRIHVEGKFARSIRDTELGDCVGARLELLPDEDHHRHGIADDT